MKYIFCGYMFPDVEADVKAMKTAPPVSAHKYMVNLVRGLIENGQDVTVVNTPRLRYYPHYPHIFINNSPFVLDGKELGVNTGLINLPLLNYMTRAFAMKRALKKSVNKLGNEVVVLVSFNSFLPINTSMVYTKRANKNVRLCGVIGDLFGNYGVARSGNWMRKRIIRMLEDQAECLAKQFDTYVFLTKYMAKALGVESRPCVVIEGMYSGEVNAVDEMDSGEKRIFYAGAISREYGILHLLNAFSQIKGDEYRLELAGGGDAEKNVKSFASRDSRIVFLGYIPPSEVEKHQREATVLVNPRTSDQEFVKYSFPSKNMECLASGKPYIAHDLICNPEEYRAYIQYPADESDEALAKKIVEICSLSAEERTAIGKKAQEFILTEKNAKKQCEKIVKMMEEFESGC